MCILVTRYFLQVLIYIGLNEGCKRFSYIGVYVISLWSICFSILVEDVDFHV